MQFKYLEITAKPDALYTPTIKTFRGIHHLNCPVCGEFLPLRGRRTTCHGCQVHLTYPDPIPPLLAEYRLWPGAYRALVGLREADKLTWPHPVLKAVGGNAAKNLRQFVDRGLLNGPSRSQDIDAASFSLAAEGLHILDRLALGLHTSAWFKAKRPLLAQLIKAGGRLPCSELKHTICLEALLNAGYVESNGEVVQVTALGRMAYWERPLETMVVDGKLLYRFSNEMPEGTIFTHFQHPGKQFKCEQHYGINPATGQPDPDCLTWNATCLDDGTPCGFYGCFVEVISFPE